MQGMYDTTAWEQFKRRTQNLKSVTFEHTTLYAVYGHHVLHIPKKLPILVFVTRDHSKAHACKKRGIKYADGTRIENVTDLSVSIVDSVILKIEGCADEFAFCSGRGPYLIGTPAEKEERRHQETVLYQQALAKLTSEETETLKHHRLLTGSGLFLVGE